MDTQMAISNYLGVLLVVLLVYPFVLVGLQMAIYDVKVRSKATRWFNVICAFLLGVMLLLHLQTEVFYGKELLDAWYAANPEDRPQ